MRLSPTTSLGRASRSHAANVIVQQVAKGTELLDFRHGCPLPIRRHADLQHERQDDQHQGGRENPTEDGGRATSSDDIQFRKGLLLQTDDAGICDPCSAKPKYLEIAESLQKRHAGVGDAGPFKVQFFEFAETTNVLHPSVGHRGSFEVQNLQLRVRFQFSEPAVGYLCPYRLR